MGFIAYIHPEDLVDMPAPVCARPGDEFEVIEYNNDLPSGMFPGALAVVLLSPRPMLNGMYVLKVGDALPVVHITFGVSMLKVKVFSLHGYFKSGEYRLDTLKIHGRVIELYPTGDLTARWIYYQPGLSYEASDLPVLLKKFTRK